MKKLQFKRVGILIGITLLISIGVQAWRLYSQFRLIESQLVNDIQQSLDNAVENYYADIAKTDVITLTDNLLLERPAELPVMVDTMPEGFDPDELFQADTTLIPGIPNSFMQRVGKSKMIFKAIEGAEKGRPDSIFWSEVKNDSLKTFSFIDSSRGMGVDQVNNLKVFWGQKAADSLSKIKYFTNQIIFSITRDTIEVGKINNLLKKELNRKAIDINFKLTNRNEKAEVDSVELQKLEKMPFKAISRSTFLPQSQSLELYFENTALTVLKRGIVEILTSVLFLVVIAFAFYYLYQTIKTQKEIAEIKEDLIGNITHEFKTPIATTLSAIEGIEKFNPSNDQEKTKRYLGISKVQMLKLNQMVEKLLESATLDSEQLGLKPEAIDLVPTLQLLVQKYQTINPEKSIELVLPCSIHELVADPFHFENVISNLLDNAQKYGGNEIRISLEQNGNTKIRVWDSGGNISLAEQARVFEQFYRIPKGNLHDVKGFGIGLYYVKKIIEKHGGKISLESGKNSTSFTTIWP